MQLVPWEKEPQVSHWLAIFKGPENDFKKFLKLWFEWRGGLDLSIASLTPDAVPWIEIVTKPASAYAVSINKRPAYFLVGRWTEDRHWSLFYKSEDKILATEEITGDSMPPSRGEPRGTYLPWGFLAKESRTDDSERDEIVLLLPDGKDSSSKRITLAPATHFSDITSLPGLQTVFSGREGPIGPCVITDGAPVNSSTYVLPLRLVTAREDAQALSPQNRVNRLQREVNRMQEQLDTLRWWCEADDVPVRLNIYPETFSNENGSFWELRDWFASASDQAIEQFSHLRIASNSLRKDFPPHGALHLVRPTRYETEPTATLPRPRKEFSFLLDQRWKRKGRKVFVPEGHELWPPPPWDNEHVTELLTRCLWEGAKADDTLILLRMLDGREFRFTVGGFQPLARQVKALNFKVAMTKASYVSDPSNSDGFETLAAQCQQDVQEHVLSHAEQMKAVLDELWNDERADLEGYSRQVREALAQISKITEINKQLTAFTNTNWNVWSDFREQVLKLDAQMLPTQRKGLADQLRQLANIRTQLSMLWRNDTDINRQQLAASLKDLAQRVLESR